MRDSPESAVVVVAMWQAIGRAAAALVAGSIRRRGE